MQDFFGKVTVPPMLGRLRKFEIWLYLSHLWYILREMSSGGESDERTSFKVQSGNLHQAACGRGHSPGNCAVGGRDLVFESR